MNANEEARSRIVAEEARETEWQDKGFLRDLFLGSFHLELVLPSPSVSLHGERSSPRSTSGSRRSSSPASIPSSSTRRGSTRPKS